MAVSRTNFASLGSALAVRERRVRRTRYHVDLERRVVEVLTMEPIDPITGDPSSTHLKITFSRPVLDNEALRSLVVYVISTSTPGAIVPSVLAVTPEDVAEPSYVFLTTTEMTDGASYACEIQNVEAA